MSTPTSLHSSVMMSNRTVLGIDPGYGRMGWGILSIESGNPRYVAAGCIETSAKDSGTERLGMIARDLRTIIAKYQPQLVGIEHLLFTKNVSTGIRVGEARGVALLICHEFNLPIEELSPSAIKLATAGHGNATKAMVGHMIATQLHLRALPRPDDAVDALAIALCASTSYAPLRRHHHA